MDYMKIECQIHVGRCEVEERGELNVQLLNKFFLN